MIHKFIPIKIFFFSENGLLKLANFLPNNKISVIIRKRITEGKHNEMKYICSKFFSFNPKREMD
jgi:hypothetical protein